MVNGNQSIVEVYQSSNPDWVDQSEVVDTSGKLLLLKPTHDLVSF